MCAFLTYLKSRKPLSAVHGKKTVGQVIVQSKNIQAKAL
jgi:hypothetical protein